MQEISLKCAISWEIEGSICYNETCLRKFWGDKGDMDALNILNRCGLVEIPLEGKEYREHIALWLVLRPEVIPEPTLSHLIDDFEKHVLHFRGLSEKTPAWRAASDCRCIVWVGIGADRINADGFSISDFFDNTQENAAEAAEALWQIEHIKEVLGGKCQSGRGANVMQIEDLPCYITISIAQAERGWTQVVSGMWSFWEIAPHTKIIVKRYSHSKSILAAQNPSMLTIPLTDGRYWPLVSVPKGWYYKKVPITELTEEDKQMAQFMEYFHGRRRT